jgi:hypothetical protein
MYMESSHLEQCRESARRLLELRSIDGEYTTSIGDIAPTAFMRDEYVSSLRSYRSACFSRVDEGLGSVVFGDSIGARILESAGVLRGPDGVERCGASIVAGRLVTARHCISFAPCEQSGCAIEIGSGWTFENFSGSLSLVLPERKLKDSEARSDRATVEDDWVAIDVGPINQTRAPVSRIRAPTRWEPLFLISYNVHARLLSSGERGAPIDSNFEADVDLSPLCRVALSDGAILFHACQTDLGTSGSPLFGIDADGEPALVGVQAGLSSKASNACTERLSQYFPNFAVALPDRLWTAGPGRPID